MGIFPLNLFEQKFISLFSVCIVKKLKLEGQGYLFIWFEIVFLYLELNKNPVEGFSAGLIEDSDLYRWEVLIIGPPDTLQ